MALVTCQLPSIWLIIFGTADCAVVSYNQPNSILYKMLCKTSLNIVTKVNKVINFDKEPFLFVCTDGGRPRRRGRDTSRLLPADTGLDKMIRL